MFFIYVFTIAGIQEYPWKYIFFLNNWYSRIHSIHICFVCVLLVKVSKAQTHIACQCIPGWRMEGILLIGGRQIIIQKAWPWTLVGNLFGECHASYTLKTSFVILKKSRRIVALTKDDIFRPYPLSILFSRMTHLFPHFYIHLTYHWTCSRFKYS